MGCIQRCRFKAANSFLDPAVSMRWVAFSNTNSVFSISPSKCQTKGASNRKIRKHSSFSSSIHFRRKKSSAEATQMPLQSLALHLPLPPYSSSMCAGFAEGPCQEWSRAI
eukprot:s2179_g14.t1